MKLKTAILMLTLGATAAFAQTRFSIGVHVGDGSGYYPQPVYGYQPYAPQDYGWNGGYYGDYPRYDKHWRKEVEKREKERRKAWREEQKRHEKAEREWRKHQREYEREYYRRGY